MGAKKKIWVLSELFHPEETASAYIITRIANHLSKTYYVNVISGPEFYDHDKTEFSDKKKISNKIKIFRFNLFNLNKNSLFSRFIKHVLLSLWMNYILIKNLKKNELVISVTNPPFLIITLFLFKKIKKFKLHVLVHDVFPENTIPAGIFKNNKNILFRITKGIYDRAYSSVDHLIVLGRDMKKLMRSKTTSHNKNLKISIVSNWSKTIKAKQNDNFYIKKKNISILYSGNIGRVQGLFEIFNAFKLSKNTNSSLYLYGSGAIKSNLIEFVKKNKISNIFFRGTYSRNDETKIIKNYDIALVSLSDGMYGLGVPSKTYNILSHGKPILYIGHPKSEVSLLIKEFKIGWSLDIRNTNEIILFFNRLHLINKISLKEMGANAKKLAKSNFQEKDILNLFQSKIEEI